MSGVSTKRPATLADLMAIPEEERFHEVIGGELVRKAAPSGEHGGAQFDLAALLATAYRRPSGAGRPGGWWFAAEVEIELAPHEIYRPDLLGWRRERVPERPRGMPIRIRPDWVCEVLSRTSEQRDRGTKFEGYRRAGVPHYWLVDPQAEMLTVHRWTQEGYLVVLNASRGERVRAEPFDAIELQVGILFGDDPDD